MSSTKHVSVVRLSETSGVLRAWFVAVESRPAAALQARLDDVLATPASSGRVAASFMDRKLYQAFGWDLEPGIRGRVASWMRVASALGLRDAEVLPHGTFDSASDANRRADELRAELRAADETQGLELIGGAYSPACESLADRMPLSTVLNLVRGWQVAGSADPFSRAVHEFQVSPCDVQRAYLELAQAEPILDAERILWERALARDPGGTWMGPEELEALPNAQQVAVFAVYRRLRGQHQVVELDRARIGMRVDLDFHRLLTVQACNGRGAA